MIEQPPRPQDISGLKARFVLFKQFDVGVRSSHGGHVQGTNQDDCFKMIVSIASVLLKLAQMFLQRLKPNLANFVPGVLCRTKVQESFCVPMNKVGY